MKVVFVSLISRDNRPLYTQPFPSLDSSTDDTNCMNELLKYNFLSHMSLDIFESPFRPTSSATPSLFFVQEGIQVYGGETNIGLKIVIGCIRGKEDFTDENDDLELNELKKLFDAVRKEYLKLTCNPFLSSEKSEDEIKNDRFDGKIKSLVEDWNSKNHIE